MRFAPYTTVVLGIVAAACAVPLKADKSDDVSARDIGSGVEARALADSERLFARSELDARLFGKSKDPQVIKVHLFEPQNPPKEPTLPAAKVKKMVEDLMKAAARKIKAKGAKYEIVGDWKGPKNFVQFEFSWAGCPGGVCDGQAYGGNEGMVIGSDQQKTTVYENM